MSLNKEYLESVACTHGRNWLRKQPNLQIAWESCPVPQWMLWALWKIQVEDGVDVKPIFKIIEEIFKQDQYDPNSEIDIDDLMDRAYWYSFPEALCGDIRYYAAGIIEPYMVQEIKVSQ